MHTKTENTFRQFAEFCRDFAAKNQPIQAAYFIFCSIGNKHIPTPLSPVMSSAPADVAQQNGEERTAPRRRELREPLDPGGRGVREDLSGV